MNHQENFLTLVEELRPYVSEVNVSEVYDSLNNKENFVLIDVREDYEWQLGRIENAIHLARGIIERDIETKILDKDTKLVLYCGGGYRSILAAYNIQKMGYNNVFSMAGGVRDWMANGYELLK
jgi:rhodanese-related sulfurtransferase